MKKFIQAIRKLSQRRRISLTHQTVLLNAYFSQLILLVIGIGILFFQEINIIKLLNWNHTYVVLGFAVLFAILVLITDVWIAKWVPEEVIDDGGLNELLFRFLPLWHIVILVSFVAISEEILFRGALQHAWGNYWTSIFFAAIHFRYLKHWLMTGLVFCISYGLGWIYDFTNTLWTPIIAHFLIDFVLACVIRFRSNSNQ